MYNLAFRVQVVQRQKHALKNECEHYVREPLNGVAMKKCPHTLE